MRKSPSEKNNEIIHIHMYVLTFDKSEIPKEICIGYTIESVEQFIAAPLQSSVWEVW